MSVRVLEFRAALPMQHNPLHRKGLLGADLIERVGEEKTMLDVAAAFRSECVRIEREDRQNRLLNCDKCNPQIPKLRQELEELDLQIEAQRDLINDARSRVRARVTLPAVNKELDRLIALRKPISKAYFKLVQYYEAWGKLQNILDALEDHKAKIKGKILTAKKLLKKQEGRVKLQKTVDGYSDEDLAIAMQLDEANDVTHQNMLAAYRDAHNGSSLYWGCKNAIKAAVQKSRGTLSVNEKGFDGQVTLDAQIMGGDTWQALLEGKRKITASLRKIDPSEIIQRRPDGTVLYDGAKAQNQYMLTFRVGAAKDAYVEIPFHFRPERWPVDARIVTVRIRRRRLRARFQWLVQFVVESRYFDREVGAGTVGINFGWRLQKAGIRAAYWVGSDGREGELILPHDQFLKKWEYASDLQSEADNLRNQVHKQLMDWIAENKRRLPKWFKEEVQAIHLWKAKRLAKFVWQWRDRRFNGDDQIFEVLSHWRIKLNRRYFERYRNQSARTDNRRKELYLKFAAELRQHYGLVYMPKLDKKKTGKIPKPEDKASADYVRYLQKKTSISELETALKNSSMQVVVRELPYLTQTCHSCRCINDFDAAKSVMVRCESCGVKFDQDRNAALNVQSDLPPAREVG
jgi:hypothetical protein